MKDERAAQGVRSIHNCFVPKRAENCPTMVIHSGKRSPARPGLMLKAGPVGFSLLSSGGPQSARYNDPLMGGGMNVAAWGKEREAA